MLVRIEKVLEAARAAAMADELARADWADGRRTAGYLSAPVKNNVQLAETDLLARKLGTAILDALDGNETFVSAALPRKVMPPLFNRYAGSQSYGAHIDGAIRLVGNHRLRTDLSATLFLSPPESYDGGELIVEDGFGTQTVKLAAGDMVLYPGTSVHRVAPVTRGARLAAFFWIESMVRSDTQRALLFDMDNALRALGRDAPGNPALVRLAGVYHNLMRLWADT